MNDRLLKRAEVIALLGGISVPTLYRWMDKQNFPKPIKLTPNCARWKESLVLAFINAKDPYYVAGGEV